MQKQLGATLLKSQERIEGRVKKWKDLKQAMAAVKVSHTGMTNQGSAWPIRVQAGQSVCRAGPIRAES